MLKLVVPLTAALALVATSGPATAAARGADEGNVIATAPGASGSSSANPQARSKRYCFITTVTGSRLQKKICKSRQEWEAEGVEIPSNL